MISLVLGLGNIGKKYVGTRHNVGFEVVSKVADALKASPQPRSSTCDWAIAERAERKVFLAWPRTYMNLSGEAAVELVGSLEIPPGEMLVVVDDFNLPLGAVRIRPRGSAGGHNGLTSLIDELETDEFPRIRLGIGAAAGSEEVIDFVLGKFGPEERKQVDEMIARAADAVLFALEHRLEETMSKYNYNPALPESD
jgi:peptidyl-tRNA hydrolase, PTH1 family